jgi:type IV secretion system protein VirB3
MIPLALVLHALFAAAAKRDPYFFDVFMRAVRGQRRLDP